MSENEIVQPKRKGKSSAAKKEENSVAEKMPKTRKKVAKAISDDVKIEAGGKTKLARNTTAGKKAAPKTVAAPESDLPSERKERRTSTVKKVNSRAKTAAAKSVKAKPVSEKSVGGKVSKAKEIKPEPLATIGEIIESKTEKPAEDVLQSATAPPESIVFKELAAPILPQLAPENRARLQMQSPTRLFFYWSVKNNPFEPLMRAFAASAAEYKLVVKLQNLTDDTEKILPVEMSGSAWFDVESGSKYRAEIGFFAAARPFVRVMFSNSVETPRPAPSTRRAVSQDFAVSAQRFAEVLDVSGYAQDAFEMQISGDDPESADRATLDAFALLVNQKKTDFSPQRADELRRALVEMAGGAPFEGLRGRISANLFARIEAIMRMNAASLAAEKILAALQQSFNFESIEAGREIGSTVFGASSLNFPRRFRRPKISPVSSYR